MSYRHSLWALLLCWNVGHAFKNSSPFFAFSSRSPLGEHSLGSFVKASAIEELVSSSWLQCDDLDLYVIVSQPGAATADYQSSASTPYLERSLSASGGALSRISVPQVIGTIDEEQVASAVANRCGFPRRSLDPTGPIELEDAYPQIITVTMPELDKDPQQRRQQLAQHDATLNAILETSRPRSHTVLYLTSSASTVAGGNKATSEHLSHHKHGSHKLQTGGDGYKVHEKVLAGDNQALPIERAMYAGFKRDSLSEEDRRKGDGDDPQLRGDAALFEKYNFLNKGIFMGGLVTLILLTILSVGLSAVSSIQITPFAFSKEMGPQNQKKQG